MTDQHEALDLSVIIPAHNEAKALPATISALNKAIAALNLNAEIIVVDDDSTDNTAAIAQEHGTKTVQVKKRQIAAVRNAGAATAKSPRLFFVDADTIVPAETLDAALKRLNLGHPGGGCRIRFDKPIPLWASLMFKPMLALLYAIRTSGGCFLFCTQEAFNAADGFDETLYAAEELRLAKAIDRWARQNNRPRFTILKQHVITSARKLEQHKPLEMLSIIIRVMLKGERALDSRKGLGVWYDTNR